MFKKILKSNRVPLVILGLILMSMLYLSSQGGLAATPLHNPLGTDDFRVVIGRIIKALLGFSGALALLMFVWGGILWMTSSGVPDKVNKGKNTLIWATVGLVVIFTSYTLVTVLINAIAG